MSNDDFQAGKRLRDLEYNIRNIQKSINFSTDSWAGDLNKSSIEILFKEYLEIADKYNVPKLEIDEIKRIVENLTFKHQEQPEKSKLLCDYYGHS